MQLFVAKWVIGSVFLRSSDLRFKVFRLSFGIFLTGLFSLYDWPPVFLSTGNLPINIGTGRPEQLHQVLFPVQRHRLSLRLRRYEGRQNPVDLHLPVLGCYVNEPQG